MASSASSAAAAPVRSPRQLEPEQLAVQIIERLVRDGRFRGPTGPPGPAGGPGPQGEKGEPGSFPSEALAEIQSQRQEIAELKLQIDQLTRELQGLRDITFQVELVGPDGRVQSGEVHPNTGDGLLRINLREEL